MPGGVRRAYVLGHVRQLLETAAGYKYMGSDVS
jgi:hypothetical protein